MQAYVSLWSADLLDLGRAIDLVAEVADGFHLDVFDGHNVDELLFGPDLVAAVRRRTTLPIDVHLNVTDPDHWVTRFVDVGSDMVTVQSGPCPDVEATLRSIRDRGVKASLGIEVHEDVAAAIEHADLVDRYLLMGTQIGIKGVGLDPSTPDRISELRADRAGVPVFVDGGIRPETVPVLAAADAGAGGVIPGSLVFADHDPVAALQRLHALPGLSADQGGRRWSRTKELSQRGGDGLNGQVSTDPSPRPSGDFCSTLPAYEKAAMSFDQHGTVLQRWTTDAAPGVRLPGYDRAQVSAGIAHIGVGNFARVHLARYVDDCLHLPDQSAWGIVGIGVTHSPQGKAKAAAYAAQDGLYTVTEYAPDGSPSSRVIGALIDYRYAPEDPASVVELLAREQIRIVSLTITEGGYFRDEATGAFDPAHPDIQRDLASPSPRTVFGLLTEALRRRRGAGTAPFSVVSCDNLRGNGRTTRQALAGYARLADPELADWIQATVAFPDSMVDRIAPSVTAETAHHLSTATNLPDAMPAVAESFSSWVIQDDFPAGRPRLDEVGVELRDDVAEFEAVKGRILNASHMLLCFPAILTGHRLVHEAMQDTFLQQLLRQFLEHDVLPHLDGPPGLSLQDYVDSTLERFGNPAVADQLLRIATDGSSKIPTFHARTTQLLLDNGADPSREAFLLAAYRRSLTGVDDHGVTYQVNEPAIAAQDLRLLLSPDPTDALRAKPFAALHLHDNPDFLRHYQRLVDQIATDGTAATLKKLTAR